MSNDNSRLCAHIHTRARAHMRTHMHTHTHTYRTRITKARRKSRVKAWCWAQRAQNCWLMRKSCVEGSDQTTHVSQYATAGGE